MDLDGETDSSASQQRLEQVCFHDNKTAQLESQCPGSGDAELLCLPIGASQMAAVAAACSVTWPKPFQSHPVLKKGISFENVQSPLTT